VKKIRVLAIKTQGDDVLFSVETLTHQKKPFLLLVTKRYSLMIPLIRPYLHGFL